MTSLVDAASTDRAEKPAPERLKSSIRASLQNALRLLEDAAMLEFSEPPATAYFLALIAQEESAKAFLLALVRRDVIPWDRHVLGAARDHTCKQLLCIVMEYLNPDTEDFLQRCGTSAVLSDEQTRFPPKVADAMSILRWEKIERWESRTWDWAEDPEYDREALRIAEGKQDRAKQDALYVRLASDGGVAAPTRAYTQDAVHSEIERARRFVNLVEGLVEVKAHVGLDWGEVEGTFRLLFAREARSIEDDEQ